MKVERKKMERTCSLLGNGEESFQEKSPDLHRRKRKQKLKPKRLKYYKRNKNTKGKSRPKSAAVLSSARRRASGLQTALQKSSSGKVV